MCCFAQAILHVADTQIFSRPTDRNTQYLAYQMKYESAEPNAMILPLPVATPAREDSVRFIDMSDYDDFFKDLSKAFPYIQPKGLLLSARVDSARAPAANLVVHEVGNFIASFVPTVDDFDRLDPQFVIPKQTWEKIPAYADYGFAVFQLKELVGKPHPMAFEFESRTREVFFPTVHIHDGEVHSHEDFDHTLYLQHAGFDSVVGKYVNRNVKDRATGFVRSKGVAGKYCDIDKAQGLLKPDLLLHRVEVKGRHENKDMTYLAKGSPVVPSFNFRKLTRWWPLGVVLAATGWIVLRRQKLGESNEVAAESVDR